MIPRKSQAALVGYLVVAVAIFGHAWTSQPQEHRNTFDGKTYQTSDEMRTSLALMAAAMWPLYLSIKFWEAQR